MDPFTAYHDLLRTAMEDGYISEDESALLNRVRKDLGLGEMEHIKAMQHVREGTTPVPADLTIGKDRAIELYERTLQTALDDERITKDEWALIDLMQQNMSIGIEEHKRIIDSIRGAVEEEAKRIRLRELTAFLDELRDRRRT